MASKINNRHKDKYAIQELTPIIQSLIKQVDSMGEDLKANKPKNITITFENAFLKIDKIANRKEYLVIVADNSMNTSLMILESKKNLRKLSTILAG